ncbi:Ku protein [Streptomyces sp. NPDC058682]|uniref:Ku protein n=1 Tax=Streptomyces sp. NPDC058682 TaxID=3346596 RepID=UPI0036544DDC
MFFDKTHYLGPRGKYEKVYSLLEQALAKTGRAGIATFVMRQYEYLVAVKAKDGLLTCTRSTGPARSETPRTR